MRIQVELEFDTPQDWERQRWNMYSCMPQLVDWHVIGEKEEE